MTMYTISNATDHAQEQKMIPYTKYIDYANMIKTGCVLELYTILLENFR